MKTVAEFTIREVEEKGMCRVQYITDGKILLEGKEYPHTLNGHPYFNQMVIDSILKIKPPINRLVP